MLSSVVIAGLITFGFYLAGVSSGTCVMIGMVAFLFFAHNMARAEVDELKLILDDEAPGWRERNADWATTWDWNRELKRRMKRERKRTKKRSSQPLS